MSYLSRGQIVALITIALLFALAVLVFDLVINHRSKEIDYLEQSDWDKMSEDDQARAYIFGIGMKESRMKEFAEQFESHTMAQRNDEATMPLVYTFMFISPSLHSNFRTADKQLSYSDSSSSSSGGFSGGGGVGGGGGGSGAF